MVLFTQKKRGGIPGAEEEKEAKKVSPWWRYAEDFFRQVHATDLARIAPGTPWLFDSALRSVWVGPKYEVGEDKIGIPIPGLNYIRRGSNASTSSVGGAGPADEKPLIGTIPAVPSEPFIMPRLKEYEEGTDLVLSLPPDKVASLVRVLVSLSSDEEDKWRDVAHFAGVTVPELKVWISSHESGRTKDKQGKLSSTDVRGSDDELHELLQLWLRHESAARVNARLDAQREGEMKSKKKLDEELIFPGKGVDMAASYGLVNVPSNLTSFSDQVTDGLPSSSTTTVGLGEGLEDEMHVDDKFDVADFDLWEKTTAECTRAFGVDGDLRHFEQGSTEGMIPLHTEMLLSRAFKRDSSGGTSQDVNGLEYSSRPCTVCAKLKTIANKCGTSRASINCLIIKAMNEANLHTELPGIASSSVSKRSAAKRTTPSDELKRIENAFKVDPRLQACAPGDEIEGEILCLQYELLWHIQSNREKLKKAHELIAQGLDEDNEEQLVRKEKLDEASVYMSGIRELKRQQKKEKREADQLAALERAKAAVGDGRREHKPKREMGSAAQTLPSPKPELAVHRPPNAQAIMKAIEAAPLRVKKLFGLGKFANETTMGMLSGSPFKFSGMVTPRSASPILGGSPIRSPMSQIILDPFHSISDNTACCVCAGTAEASNMKQTIHCAQCDLIVHPACYGMSGAVNSRWLCCVCAQVTKAGGALPKLEKNGPISLQGKMSLYRGVSCILCPVKLGAFKKTVDGKDWCHVVCAQWVPEASVRNMSGANAVVRVDPEKIPRERRNASCSYCTKSEGTLMRCCSGHCHNVFHPLCCRRAACHMRAIDSAKRKFTAFCEKHTRAEREKDIEANLVGDPVPAIVELYPQSPLERQFSGERIRQLSTSPTLTGFATLKGNGTLSRMSKATSSRDTPVELPSSKKTNTRSNLQHSLMLPGSVPGTEITDFESEENFGAPKAAK